MTAKKDIIRILFIIGILISQNCGKKSEPTDPGNGELPTYEQSGTIGESGGIVQITNTENKLYGSFVKVPEGALLQNANISISEPSTPHTFMNDTSNISVNFSPSGLVFNEPIQIGVPYSFGTSTTDLKLFYFDQSELVWKTLPVLQVNTDDRIVIGQTNHFTEFTVSKSHVKFDVELYAADSKINAQVKLLTSLKNMPTDLITWAATGKTNIYDLIESQPTQVKAYYKVTLKEKIDFWFDMEVETVSICYGIYAVINANRYEIKTHDDLLKTENKYLEMDDVEDYYSGEPVLFKFNTSPSMDKKYYVEVKLYYVDSFDWIGNSGGLWGTQGYAVSSLDDAMTFSEMGTPPDGDYDRIVNDYDDVNDVISKPTLIQPSNGSNINDDTPYFDWESVNPADNYELIVDNNTQFSSPELHKNSVANSYYQSIVAFSNGTYYWKVRGKDKFGISGSWSDVWSFTIGSLHSVSIPSTPSGSTSGQVNQSYSYSTGSSTCSQGHGVQYRFDWGNGSYSDWSGSTSQSHSWSSSGTYNVKAQARCSSNTSIVSSWSSVLSVTISSPHSVITPSTPSGVSSGETGQSYTYSTSGSTCSQGHGVQYRFDWGNGSYSDWSGSTSQSHSWSSSGTYNVKAQARCGSNTSIASSWSSGLSVTIMTSDVDLTFQCVNPNGDELWSGDTSPYPSFTISGLAYNYNPVYKSYTPGTSINVEAGAMIFTETLTQVQVRFIRWDNGSTNTQRNITVPTNDEIYKAVYDNFYEFILSSVANGTVTQTYPAIPSDNYYQNGTVIHCVASASAGYEFSHWNIYNSGNVATGPSYFSSSNPIDYIIGGSWAELYPVFIVSQGELFEEDFEDRAAQDFIPLNSNKWDFPYDKGSYRYRVVKNSGSGDGGDQYSFINSQFMNFDLTLEARIGDEGYGNLCILFNQETTSKGNGYYLQFTGGAVNLYGASQTITNNSYSIADHDYHDIRIVLNGSQLQVYLDNNTIFNRSISKFGGGYIGVGKYGQYTSVYFDNIIIKIP